ncbi:MAG: hypothetical protein U9R44_07800 [Candidatus Omnitrophota bacterium]|nr:hypothetical protein [Candidatus Omnitrophota bacterium]
MLLTILSYAIKIIFSTFLIYFSIRIVEPGNYRNKISNALITAVILSVAGGMPFLFLFGLIVWVYILINYYSVGFFKSFLCAAVYAVLFILLNIFLATALLGGSFAYTKMTDAKFIPRVTSRERTAGAKGSVIYMISDKVRSCIRGAGEKLPGIFGKKTPKVEVTEPGKEEAPAKKIVKLILRNGGSITGSVSLEGEKGYMLDIANGAEVLVRKEEVVRIEEL